MASQFSNFLTAPAGVHKRPPLLYPGDYQGVIKNKEMGNTRGEKKSEILIVHLGLTSWPANCPAEWTEFNPDKGETITVRRDDINLSERRAQKDFFTTADSLFILDEFLESLNIGFEPGMAYGEVLPHILGRPVLIEMVKQLSQKNNREFVRVGKLVGLRS